MELTIDKDYHEYTLDQAMFDFENLLCKAELEGLTVRAITGMGVIREAFMDYLDEYAYHWTIENGNPGCIIVFPDD